jgi:hypothetical protein
MNRNANDKPPEKQTEKPGTKCHANLHMTPEEFAYWEVWRSLTFHTDHLLEFSSKDASFLFDATRPQGVNRPGAIRRALMERGWMKETRAPFQDKVSGQFLPPQYYVLSHEEWAAAHPEGCEMAAQALVELHAGRGKGPKKTSTGVIVGGRSRTARAQAYFKSKKADKDDSLYPLACTPDSDSIFDAQPLQNQHRKSRESLQAIPPVNRHPYPVQAPVTAELSIRDPNHHRRPSRVPVHGDGAIGITDVPVLPLVF